MAAKKYEHMTLESGGGPFLVFPTAKLAVWGGVTTQSYFEDEDDTCSNDYEIVCDRMYDQDAEHSSAQERDFFIVYSATRGIDITYNKRKLIIAETTTPAKFVSLLLSDDPNDQLPPDVIESEREFLLNAEQFSIFEAARSQQNFEETNMYSTRILKGPITLRDFTLKAEDLNSSVQELWFGAD